MLAFRALASRALASRAVAFRVLAVLALAPLAVRALAFRVLAVLALALLALAAGATTACYDTPKPECAFECGDQGQCPAGYACAPDRWCKRDDVAPSYDCGSDLSAPDAAPSADATPP